MFRTPVQSVKYITFVQCRCARESIPYWFVEHFPEISCQFDFDLPFMAHATNASFTWSLFTKVSDVMRSPQRPWESTIRIWQTARHTKQSSGVLTEYVTGYMSGPYLANQSQSYLKWAIFWKNRLVPKPAIYRAPLQLRLLQEQRPNPIRIHLTLCNMCTRSLEENTRSLCWSATVVHANSVRTGLIRLQDYIRMLY